MNDDLERRIAELERIIEIHEQRWRNFRIAPESGNGSVVISDRDAVIRIDSLTSDGAKFPGV